jgi:uncharacterized membrane protein YagU involved in acid resistance
MPSTLQQACQGALAGFAATGPMTAFMAGVHASLPRHEQSGLPPREITERVTAKAGVHQELSEGEHQGLTAVAHFTFGSSVGALYGPLAHHFRPSPILGGVAYGLAVWAIHYLGLLPAAGLYRSPTREPARRHGMMIGAHVVWGAVLGLIVDSFLDEKPQRSRPEERSRHDAF